MHELLAPAPPEASGSVKRVLEAYPPKKLGGWKVEALQRVPHFCGRFFFPYYAFFSLSETSSTQTVASLWLIIADIWGHF